VYRKRVIVSPPGRAGLPAGLDLHPVPVNLGELSRIYAKRREGTTSGRRLPRVALPPGPTGPDDPAALDVQIPTAVSRTAGRKSAAMKGMVKTGWWKAWPRSRSRSLPT
jgi:hypothetical protein